MRVSTAFNKMLGLAGAWVETVEFTEAGIVVGLRLRARSHRCRCGRRAAGYDYRRRRWRHLDLGACKLWLEAENLEGGLPLLRHGPHRGGSLGSTGGSAHP